MKAIDEKFKEVSPKTTVERIKKILCDLGIRVGDSCVDAGLDHCYSVSVFAEGGYPATNGKGVTEDLALASGYAEFMERLQCGLFLLPGMNEEKTPSVYLHTYAPDGRYMTESELIEDGDWMDFLISEYPGLTREKIAKICSLYAYNSTGKMLTLPFYSLFEKKYVYLPAGFVERMYTANGCCAGNTRDEAWVHALSEILERNRCAKMVASGEALPAIPDDVLSGFPIVRDILENIKKTGYFDIKIFDCSYGCGFPVIATRIIDKRSSKYIVCVGSDPVLEIAIERTLTEIFQGKTVETFKSLKSERILVDVHDISATENIRNQFQAGNALFTVDFFSDELSCTRKCGKFEDNSNMANSELLQKMIVFYKKLGKPVYVRNYSFLGFNTYKIVVPGFSESRGLSLCEPVQKHYFLLRAAEALKYIENADQTLLSDLLMVDRIGVESINNSSHFGRLAGIPIVGGRHQSLLYIHFAYASYKLKDFSKVCYYLNKAFNAAEAEKKADQSYIKALQYYFEFAERNVPVEKILSVIKKFCIHEAFDRLKCGLEKENVFDGMLVRCDRRHCDSCPLKDDCRFVVNEKIISIVGKEYAKFTDGQSEKHFQLDIT